MLFVCSNVFFQRSSVVTTLFNRSVLMVPAVVASVEG